MSDSFFSSDRWVAYPATPEGMLGNNPPLAVVVYLINRFLFLINSNHRTIHFKSDLNRTMWDSNPAPGYCAVRGV